MRRRPAGLLNWALALRLQRISKFFPLACYVLVGEQAGDGTRRARRKLIAPRITRSSSLADYHRGVSGKTSDRYVSACFSVYRQEPRGTSESGESTTAAASFGTCPTWPIGQRKLRKNSAAYAAETHAITVRASRQARFIRTRFRQGPPRR